MHPQQVEQLRQRYTGQYVAADAGRPELARFAGMVGQVKTINMSGRALVQFEGANEGWIDIELERLTVVEKPAPPPEPPPKRPAAAKKPAAEKTPEA